MARLIELTRETIDARARAREADRRMDAIRAKISDRIQQFNLEAGIQQGQLAQDFLAFDDMPSNDEEILLQSTDTESADDYEDRTLTPEEQELLLADSATDVSADHMNEE